MRCALAIGTALLLLLGIAAPHAHHGPLGSHACVACVTASGEEAGSATPDPAPPRLVEEAELAPAPMPPVTGAPLGAIPGQSPPRA